MFGRRRRQQPAVTTDSAVDSVALLDRPILVNDRPTTLRELDHHAHHMVHDADTPWTQGLALTVLYLIDRLTHQDEALRALLQKWKEDRLEYPLDDGRASVAFLTVKACEEELAQAMREGG